MTTQERHYLRHWWHRTHAAAQAEPRRFVLGARSHYHLPDTPGARAVIRHMNPNAILPGEWQDEVAQ